MILLDGGSGEERGPSWAGESLDGGEGPLG